MGSLPRVATRNSTVSTHLARALAGKRAQGLCQHGTNVGDLPEWVDTLLASKSKLREAGGVGGRLRGHLHRVRIVVHQRGRHRGRRSNVTLREGGEAVQELGPGHGAVAQGARAVGHGAHPQPPSPPTATHKDLSSGGCPMMEDSASRRDTPIAKALPVRAGRAVCVRGDTRAWMAESESVQATHAQWGATPGAFWGPRSGR